MLFYLFSVNSRLSLMNSRIIKKKSKQFFAKSNIVEFLLFFFSFPLKQPSASQNELHILTTQIRETK